MMAALPQFSLSAERSPALVSLRNLCITYGSAARPLPAVNNVSLTIAPGQAVGIVGESGSGKSTLARSLLGLLPEKVCSVRADAIEIEGRPIEPSRLGSLRGTVASMVFQDPLSYLNPLMTAGRQIAEAVQLHDRSSDVGARVDSLLQQVRLPIASRTAYPHELSGGMRQRVLLAIALACKPRLLIADEPTTALDVTTQREILELIQRLRDELGMALLLISHDMGVVSTLCEHIHVMLRGQVVEHGETATVFDAARHPYTRGLLAAARSMRDEHGRFVTLQQGPSFAPMVSAVPPAAPSENRTPILEIRNVSKSFRQRGGQLQRAVHNVSLVVHPGETMALVGESGSGKSTLSRIALGLLAPDSGHILFQSHDLNALSSDLIRQHRTRMQPVFQDAGASFNPRRNVLDSLMQATPTLPAGSTAVQHATWLLAQVGLVPAGDYLGRYPHELSGGQRQRLAIARALAMEPQLVVADEPLSGADVSVRGQILNLLLDLQAQRHLAYLFITHDISLARAFAHRVAVMYRGEIVEQGQAQQVLDHPQHPYTQRLVAAAIRLDRADASPTHLQSKKAPHEETIL